MGNQCLEPMDESTLLFACGWRRASLSNPLSSPVRRLLSEVYPRDAADGVFDGRNPLKANYLIPKPFDPRVVPRVARRVAEAAMACGTARQAIDDLGAYEDSLLHTLAGT